MQYPRIIEAITSEKWAITPGAFEAIRVALEGHMLGNVRQPTVAGAGKPSPRVRQKPSQKARAGTEGDPADPDDDEDEDEMADCPYVIHGTVAIIPVNGIIGKYLSWLDSCCGGYDLNSLERALNAYVQDARVDRGVLFWNSPGGVVTGVPEMASLVAQTDASKPLFSFCDTRCCSAAYWIGSQARQFGITPTAQIGSIGVYMALKDSSKNWEKEGFKMELIKAGSHKAAGIEGLPLADADRQMFQGQIDDIYNLFKADIAAKRPGVSDETMQGQSFMGQKAIDAKLADGLFSSFSQFIAELAQQVA